MLCHPFSHPCPHYTDNLNSHGPISEHLISPLPPLESLALSPPSLASPTHTLSPTHTISTTALPPATPSDPGPAPGKPPSTLQTAKESKPPTHLTASVANRNHLSESTSPSPSCLSSCLSPPLLDFAAPTKWNKNDPETTPKRKSVETSLGIRKVRDSSYFSYVCLSLPIYTYMLMLLSTTSLSIVSCYFCESCYISQCLFKCLIWFLFDTFWFKPV